MTIRILSIVGALALTLVCGVRPAQAQGPEVAIDAVVASAQALVTQLEEAILEEFLAYVERDAGPRELKRLAKSMDKGTIVTFNGFERQVKLVADNAARMLRRGGATSSEVAGLRVSRNSAIADLKTMEADLRLYIKETLQAALDGTLAPPDDGDGGGGGGPGDPGGPGNPGNPN